MRTFLPKDTSGVTPRTGYRAPRALGQKPPPAFWSSMAPWRSCSPLAASRAQADDLRLYLSIATMNRSAPLPSLKNQSTARTMRSHSTFRTATTIATAISPNTCASHKSGNVGIRTTSSGAKMDIYQTQNGNFLKFSRSDASSENLNICWHCRFWQATCRSRARTPNSASRIHAR